MGKNQLLSSKCDHELTFDYHSQSVLMLIEFTIFLPPFSHLFSLPSSPPHTHFPSDHTLFITNHYPYPNKKGTTYSLASLWLRSVALFSQVYEPSWSRRPASPPTPWSPTISWQRGRTTATCCPAWSSRCPSSTPTRTITWITPLS